MNWNQADWQQIWLGNPLICWAEFLAIVLVGLIFSGLLSRFSSWGAYRLFRKFSQGKFFEEFHRLLKRPFLHIIQLIFLYLAFDRLSFPESWNFVSVDKFGLRWLIQSVFLIVFIVAWMRIFKRGADFMEYVYVHMENSPISPDLAAFLRRLIIILIYIMGFFTILGKAFEVNITALVTSLGIGGLAIALAAQDTLANLIGSFIIYIDKPFNVGDLVEVGDIRGIVEKIGFRTTRIRTLDRSLLIVPNKKIIDSNLNNITQSSQRRVKFNLALTYQSKPEQLQQLRDSIEQAIKSEGEMVSDEITVRFIDFDASSLNILVIYIVNSNVYELMAEVRERLNLRIMQLVEEHGCAFAYPTQTLYLNKDSEGSK